MPSIATICNELMSVGVIIRELNDYNLKDFVRISVGIEAEIKQLLDELKTILKK
jgi:histidinol-phosphate/aromatic aminotransferase/cobyric acid decarboxylase-like protein